MSPKNKGKFGKGKSEIEQEDEFLTTMDRVVKAMQPYVKQIVIGTSVIAVVLVAFFSWQWWNQRKEAAATELFEKALVHAQVPVLSVDAPADDKDGEDGADKAAEPELPDRDGDGVPDEYHTLAQRAEAALVHLDSLEAEYGSTKVAAQARLLRAKLLYDAGRHADAETTYRAFLADADSDHQRRIARVGLGYSIEAQAQGETPDADQLRRAQAVFKEIQSADEGPGKDLALYHEARILAELGEPDKAIAALEKALEVAPESDIRYDINMRLVLLRSGE